MSRKAPLSLSPQQKAFVNKFNTLCDRHISWQVWADFIELCACSISNAVDRRQEIYAEREQRYLDIIKRYTHKEQNVFPELFCMVVNALQENPEQDFLGELFMGLELSNHWKGQFFTPYTLCEAMAKIQCLDIDQTIKRQGWASISDPACGAGALLVAARNEFIQKNVGGNQVLFMAQDIDRVAGLMCYIQLSLLGCAGYIVIADSLLHPVEGSNALVPVFTEAHDVWFTPLWFSDVWSFRRLLYSAEFL